MNLAVNSNNKNAVSRDPFTSMSDKDCSIYFRMRTVTSGGYDDSTDREDASNPSTHTTGDLKQ